MKQKVFYALFTIIFVFAFAFGIFLMNWIIKNSDAITELESLTTKLIVENNELTKENEDLRTYVSVLERYK